MARVNFNGASFFFSDEESAQDFVELNGGSVDLGDFPRLDPDFYESKARFDYYNPPQPEDYEYMDEEPDT